MLEHSDAARGGAGRRLPRVAILLIALAIFVGAPAVWLFFSVYKTYRVPTGGMRPTIPVGARVLMRRYARSVRFAPRSLGIAQIERGDIAAFRFPPDPSFSYMQRVVALPGETIEVRDGRAFVKGAALREPYAFVGAGGDPREQGRTFPPYQLPAGCYFVMGDNRDHSFDSRYWGCVPAENFIGKIVQTWTWFVRQNEEDEAR